MKSERSDVFINLDELKDRVVKMIATVYVTETSPVMESLTGIMIAALNFLFWKIS